MPRINMNQRPNKEIITIKSDQFHCLLFQMEAEVMAAIPGIGAEPQFSEKRQPTNKTKKQKNQKEKWRQFLETTKIQEVAGARGRTEEGDACVSGAFNTNRNLINANNAESGRNRVNKAIEGDGRRFFNKVLVSDSLSSFGLFVLQHIVVCVESRERERDERDEKSRVISPLCTTD